MNQFRRQLLIALAAGSIAVPPLSAGVTVTVERTTGGSGFRFPSVPAPSNNDAATAAQFLLIDGQRDSNGGDLAVLHDGRAPTDEDQPGANFFFRAGGDGGRLRIDLGAVISVKRIGTYSWHGGTRGPQVYRVYGADGAGTGFQAEPRRGTDPAQCGWTLIATVDTRPGDGDGGGAHGVSIAAGESTVGRFRHLLFDVQPTETRDAFGHTFFSEIDVVDANGPAPSSAVGLAQVTREFEAENGRYRFTLDVTAAPDLLEWVEKELKPVVQTWYPRIVALLPGESFQAATNVTLRFRNDMGPVPAAAGGAGVRLNSGWFRRELKGEARGAVVHELVHVVQNYGRARSANPNTTRTPGWLVEGIADYVRWFLYEPQSKGAEITARNFERARHDSSYRVTANFLDWASTRYDRDLVRKLNAAAREGRYSDSIWKDTTGRSIQELGEEWREFNRERLGLLKGDGDRKATPANPPDKGRTVLESIPSARFEFGGPVGERVQANVDQWLLRAPLANPGMLGMFRVRDRQPVPQLVPWAGEFAGKYLISAVQALRMTGDARLRPQVEAFVAEWIAAQAEDGYLGPFPKADRLLKNWDLWGHYHAVLALAQWHEYSGDPAALAAARKAADLVCNTYLDTGRRVYDAGDPEMNMAILTGMALMHRVTGEPRYLRMAREVEKDWERAGDYLRSGLDGREYFRSPRPRWESLHDLQGLVELWRITGEARYRDAFVHHWRSIRRWDQRNTGGFSSGEQATGNPFAPTAIETCCTVAWMALTIDYLRLTGDASAVDDLELALLNGGLGAQHPSGRWWTYNTPMDGAREASAHTIVFQARAGTPELNCCSVNAPRVLGSLGEWAVMGDADGLTVNWLGAGQTRLKLPDGAGVMIASAQDAWLTGRTVLQVETRSDREFTLRVRIPGWSRQPRLELDGKAVAGAMPGSWVALRQKWTGTHVLEVTFELPLRSVAGANEAGGRASIYRGPVLLAYDQAQNLFDEEAIPAVDLARLAEARVGVTPSNGQGSAGRLEPWLRVDAKSVQGLSVQLVDFANAGARGTRYRSWLPVTPVPPAPAFTQLPADAARIPPGPVPFRWRGPRGGEAAACRVEFSGDTGFAPSELWSTNVTGSKVVLDTARLGSLARSPGAPVYWRVVTMDGRGETVPDVPPAWFRVDPGAAPVVIPPEPVRGPDGEILVHALRGASPPSFGMVPTGKFSAQETDGTVLNGRDQMLVYRVGPWPEEDFTVRVRVRLEGGSTKRFGQVFSAWTAGMDDPLRIVVEGGKVYARIESGGSFSTPGATIEAGRWHAVAAVKAGGTLTLYIDGRAVGSCPAPELSNTRAEDCALGGNPHYTGDEFLAARFADFRMHGRALSAGEIRSWSQE